MEVERDQMPAATWGWGPLRFEFGCDDSELTARLQTVTAAWEAPPPPGPENVCRMTATQQGTGWTFVGSQPGAAGYCADAAAVTRAAEADATLAVLNRPDLFLTVHGALLENSGRAVLIVGPSLSGKSTFACALASSGWQLHGDDVATLQPRGSQPWSASGLPRRVSLRSSSRGLVGEKNWQRLRDDSAADITEEGIVFPGRLLSPGIPASAAPCSLDAIIFLNRSAAPASRKPQHGSLATPVHPAEALVALCPYTNVVRGPGGMADALARLAPLFEHLHAYDLHRADLPAMLRTVYAILPRSVEEKQ